MRIKLEQQSWTLGEPIGHGAFSTVFVARSDSGAELAAKRIPKAPGADRELIRNELTYVRNIIPVVDHGETGNHLVIVMPRCEKSLKDHLEALCGPLEVAEALSILTDLAETLVDLDGGVVHRDLKPANLLWHEGHWCTSDFGIARLAESATSRDTWKFSKSPLYASPEQWRSERATSASDVYALGVIAYEMLSGAPPFQGEVHELYEQHLKVLPPPLDTVPPRLAMLIEECLCKEAGIRPKPAEVLARLERSVERSSSPGRALLQEAGRADIARHAEVSRKASEAQSVSELRNGYYDAAKLGLARIRATLEKIILEDAPTSLVRADGDSLAIQLNRATLTLGPPVQTPHGVWGGLRKPFDVIAHTQLSVNMLVDRHGYEGRGHSLWYCDAHVTGEYHWFEAAFAAYPKLGQLKMTPLPLEPGGEAKTVIDGTNSTYRLAWSFTPVVPGELDAFVDRWITYFAQASSGRLQRPKADPEAQIAGTRRTP